MHVQKDACKAQPAVAEPARGARCTAKRCFNPGAAGAASTDRGVCPPRCSGDRQTRHLSPCRRHPSPAWHRGPAEHGAAPAAQGEEGQSKPLAVLRRCSGCHRADPVSFSGGGGGGSIPAVPNRLGSHARGSASAVPPPQRCAPLPWSGGERLQAGFTWLKTILIFKTALSGAAGLTGLFRSRVQGAKRASPLPSRSPSAVYFSVSLGKRPLVAGRDV